MFDNVTRQSDSSVPCYTRGERREQIDTSPMDSMYVAPMRPDAAAWVVRLKSMKTGQPVNGR